MNDAGCSWKAWLRKMQVKLFSLPPEFLSHPPGPQESSQMKTLVSGIHWSMLKVGRKRLNNHIYLARSDRSEFLIFRNSSHFIVMPGSQSESCPLGPEDYVSHEVKAPCGYDSFLFLGLAIKTSFLKTWINNQILTIANSLERIWSCLTPSGLYSLSFYSDLLWRHPTAWLFDMKLCD